MRNIKKLQHAYEQHDARKQRLCIAQAFQMANGTILA